MLPLRYYLATLTLALAVACLDISGVQANPSGAYGSPATPATPAIPEQQLSPCGVPYKTMPTSCGSEGWSTAILGGDMAYCVKGIACGGTNPAGRDCPDPQPSLPYGSTCVVSDGKGSMKAGLHMCVAKSSCHEDTPAEVTPAPTTLAPVTPKPTTPAPVTSEPTPCASLSYNYGSELPTPTPTPCKNLPYNYGPGLSTPAPTPCASLPYNYGPKPTSPAPSPSTTPAPSTTKSAPVTTTPAPATMTPAPTTKPPTPDATVPGVLATTPAPTMSSPGPQGGSPGLSQTTEEAKAPDTPAFAQITPQPAYVPRTDTPQSTPCVYPIKSESPTPRGKPDVSTPASHSKGAEPQGPTSAPTPAPTQVIETAGAPPSSNGQGKLNATPATDEPCPKFTLVAETKAPTPALTSTPTPASTPAPATPTPTPCIELPLKPDSTPPAVTPASTPCADKLQLKSDAPTPAPMSVIPAPLTPVMPSPSTSVTPLPSASVASGPLASVTPAPSDSVTPVPSPSVTSVPATTAPVKGDTGGFIIDKTESSNGLLPDFSNRKLRTR